MRFKLTVKIVTVLFVSFLYWISAYSIPQEEGRLVGIPSIPPPLMGGGEGEGQKGEGEQKGFSDEKARYNNVDFYKEGLVNPGSKVPSSHVSSLTWMGDGKIACVWYGGSREGAMDVKIYFSLYDENTGVWSEGNVVVSRESSSDELGRYVRKVGNPVIFSDSSDRLWLFYVTITVGGWSGSSLNYKISYDHGKTWTPSKKLVLSPFFNLSNLVKNKPMLLDGGGFLLPIYHEFINKYPEMLMVIPDGDAVQYKKWRIGFKKGLLQPSILALDEKRVVAYFRNAGKGNKKYVMESISNDAGMTWSEPLPTTLPNPNSGLDVVSTPEGSVLVVLNDSFKDRSRLALYLSKDNDREWIKIKDLEDTPGMEFSYPSIIRTPDNTYHISYTYNRSNIKHVTFSDIWLLEKLKNDS
ncbi:MAG TPA: hypothetical protein DDX84_07775 [Nitrospiraceae bacterium]|nr:hypothetical protein [Nitrospiraceae bacterium]